MLPRKQRTIRDQAPIPDNATLVRMIFDRDLRDTDFNRELLIVDASNNFELFGYFGLSLWATSDDPSDTATLFAEKCGRSKYLAVFVAGELRDKGLGLVPSGKAPHFDASVGSVYGNAFGSVQIVAPNAADLVARFMSAPYTVLENPYYNEELQ